MTLTHGRVCRRLLSSIAAQSPQKIARVLPSGYVTTVDPLSPCTTTIRHALQQRWKWDLVQGIATARLDRSTTGEAIQLVKETHALTEQVQIVHHGSRACPSSDATFTHDRHVVSRIRGNLWSQVAELARAIEKKADLAKVFSLAGPLCYIFSRHLSR